MAKSEEITTRFRVDVSDLKSGISEANQQIKLANAEFKAATAGMDDWTKSADGIKAKLQQLESVLSAQKTKLEAYNEQLSRQQSAYEENGKRAAELRAKLEELANNGVAKTSKEYKDYENALASCEKEQESNKKSLDNLRITVLDQQAAVNKTEAELGKYTTALDEVEKGADNAGKETDDLSKSVKESGKTAEESAGGFSVMKAALADLVASGIKAAISGLKDLAKDAYASWESFDEGADSIIAATGATGEAADSLIESYKNVSRNIVGDFGNIGDAIGEVNTRFGSTGSDLERLTEKFLKFSDLNGTDVKGSIDSVQSALEAFGLSGDYAGSMLDMLNKAGQDTGVNVQTLTQQLVANAPQLQEMGYNASDSAMFIANLSKSGIEASTVMAGMKKAFQNAQKEGKPLSEAMAEIEESIKNADSSTEAITIATELFGSKAGPAIASAVQQGRLSFEEFGTSLSDFNGNIDETYENMLDGPDRIQLALQNLKLTAAEVIDKFLQEHGPQIEEMVQRFIDDVLPVLSSALDKVLEAVDWIINNLDWLAPLAGVIGGIAIAIGTVTAAQQVLNAVMAANPIGLIIAAIGALVAAFVYLWNNCEEFREFWINLWAKIKEVASAIWEAITKFFSEAWDKIKGIWSGVKEWFTEKFEAARDGIKNAWGNVKGWFSDRWNDIKNAFSNTKEWFKEKFEAARDAVKKAWEKAGPWFSEKKDQIQNAFAKVDSWMGDKFGAAWDDIKFRWRTVIDFFKNIWESIKKIFSVVQSVLSGDFQGAWDGIRSIVDQWKGYFSGVWDGIKEVYSKVGDWFKEKFTSAKEGLQKAFEPVTNFFQKLWDGIKKIFEPVGRFFGDTFEAAKNAVAGPLNFIIRGINQLIRGVNKVSFDVPDWVPVIGGQKWGFNIPEIPELARGGILRRGQTGFLEGNGAEAVIPLERNKFWIHSVAADLLRQIQLTSGGSTTNIGGTKDYNFTQIINAPQAPSRIEIYRQTRNLLSYAKATAGGV